MGFGNLDLTLVILDQSSNSAPNAQKPTTQTLYQRLRVEKEGEEADVPFEGAAAAPDLSPKRGTEGCSARSQRSRSYGNGYGCTTFNDDEENTKDAEQGQDLNKQFEVRFEGVSDPMNPRSSGKTRKWLIVYLLTFHIRSNYDGVPHLSSSRHVGTELVCFGIGTWSYGSWTFYLNPMAADPYTFFPSASF